MTKQTIGGIGWRDLTCENAEGLRDFYEDVVGWQSSPVSMGDYNDFNMMDVKAMLWPEFVTDAAVTRECPPNG